MMGRQISFYLDTKMEMEMENKILELGFISIIGKNKKIEITNTIPKYRKNTCNVWKTLYIFTNLSKVKIKKIENSREYIDVLNSEVIEYSRSYKENDVFDVNSKMIFQGRLYIVNYILDENNNYIKKSEEILKAYEQLVQWIKKRCPKSEYVKNEKKYKEYMSPEIKRLVEEEGYILG